MKWATAALEQGGDAARDKLIFDAGDFHRGSPTAHAMRRFAPSAVTLAIGLRP
jgi:hypothetical protein